MIAGRPTNLWLGFVTAAVGFASVVAVAVFHADPTTVATVGGSATGLLGAGVALIAGQPPTVSEGDRVHVVTDAGQPNYTIEATNTPPPVTVTDK